MKRSGGGSRIIACFLQWTHIRVNTEFGPRTLASYTKTELLKMIVTSIGELTNRPLKFFNEYVRVNIR